MVEIEVLSDTPCINLFLEEVMALRSAGWFFSQRFD